MKHSYSKAHIVLYLLSAISILAFIAYIISYAIGSSVAKAQPGI